jgi:hypothetical protein
MSGPYRGRGRGRGGHGRGRGFNINPSQESNIPLIGDWTTVAYKNKQNSKKDEASSSPVIAVVVIEELQLSSILITFL